MIMPKSISSFNGFHAKILVWMLSAVLCTLSLFSTIPEWTPLLASIIVVVNLMTFVILARTSQRGQDLPAAPDCFSNMISTRCKAGDFNQASHRIKRMKAQDAADTVNSHNTSIDSLVETGRIEDAELWLNAMLDAGINPGLDIFSTLLCGYERAGDQKNATAIYHRMREREVAPNLLCFIMLLRITARKHDIAGVAEWLAEMRKLGIHGDATCFETAISTFIESSHAAGAVELCKELQILSRDNAGFLDTLLKVCLRQKDSKHVEDIINTRLSGGFKVSNSWFTQFIEGSAKQNDTAIAEDWLNRIESNGSKAPVGACVAFVHFLMKAGVIPKLESAAPDEQLTSFTSQVQAAAYKDNLALCETLMRRMMEQRVLPSVVCYGVIIGAYARASHPDGCERWLNALLDAHQEPPNTITFNIVITACAKSGNIERAEFWLQRMRAIGVEPDRTSYNAMIDAFARVPEVSRAEAWFEALEASRLEPNIVSYSSVLNACAKAGDMVRAEAWFKRLENREKANAICFNAMINSCCKAGDFDHASHWIGKMKAKDVAPTVNSYNTVIDCLVKAGRMEDAEVWFRDMLNAGINADVIIFSTLLCGYTRQGDQKNANALYHMMRERKVAPSLLCFKMLLKIAARKHDTAEAAKWLAEMRHSGIQGDALTFKLAISTFTGSSNAAGAVELYKELQKLSTDDSGLLRAALQVCFRDKNLKHGGDIISTRLLVGLEVCDLWFKQLFEAFAKQRDTAAAEDWLNRIESSGSKAPAGAYVAFVHCLMKAGDIPRLESGLQRMEAAELTPTAAMYDAIILAYAQKADVLNAERWLQRVRETPSGASFSCYHHVIKACARSNNLHGAERWIEKMEADGVHANVVTYNIVINACAPTANRVRAEAWWMRMQAAGTRPNAHTFNTLINICGKGSDILGAEKWLERMREAGIYPDIVSYTTIIHACTRANRAERAEVWLEEMRAWGRDISCGNRKGCGLIKGPNSFCVNAVLQSFARADCPSKAAKWLAVALQEEAVISRGSFGSVVASYVRAGQTEEAERWRMRIGAEGYPIVKGSVSTFDDVAGARLTKGNHAPAAALWRLDPESQSNDVAIAPAKAPSMSIQPIGDPPERYPKERGSRGKRFGTQRADHD